MTIKFEIYDKIHYSISIKIAIISIVVFSSTWLVLYFLSIKPEFGYLRFYSIAFFIISIVSCLAYWIMSLVNKKFLPTGTIEFMEDCISINSNDYIYLIPKEKIVKLTLFMDSYDGQAEPNFVTFGNEPLDGLENRFFVQAKNINKSYKFYINNRGQIILLRKLLNNWKYKSNINIRFTDKHAKDCLKNTDNCW